MKETPGVVVGRNELEKVEKSIPIVFVGLFPPSAFPWKPKNRKIQCQILLEIESCHEQPPIINLSVIIGRKKSLKVNKNLVCLFCSAASGYQGYNAGVKIETKKALIENVDSEVEGKNENGFCDKNWKSGGISFFSSALNKCFCEVSIKFLIREHNLI